MSIFTILSQPVAIFSHSLFQTDKSDKQFFFLHVKDKCVNFVNPVYFHFIMEGTFSEQKRLTSLIP